MREKMSKKEKKKGKKKKKGAKKKRLKKIFSPTHRVGCSQYSKTLCA